ncbi:unnamed protein product [Boreogadus saida]
MSTDHVAVHVTGSLDRDLSVAPGLEGHALFVAVTTMTLLPTVGTNVYASAAMLLGIKLPLAQPHLLLVHPLPWPVHPHSRETS